jgi:ATP-dependent Clp protease adaptor protein ClpS
MTTATTTVTKTHLKQVSLFQVLLHNDDYTPMNFVIEVLKQFFGKSEDDANAIMLAIHEKGTGVAGTMKTAKMYGHPLKASVKEA